MGKRWWEEREYQLQTGRWVPQVHLYEEVPGGVEVHRLLAPEDRTFAKREDAKAYSTSMAVKWLQDRGQL